MDKSATLNLRVNPTLKKNAESVLGRLGVPMSTAVDMFLNQIVLTGGIPFAITLPSAPESIDTTGMSSEEIYDKIQRGYESYKEGRTQSAAKAFDKFRESHNLWQNIGLILRIKRLPIWSRYMNTLLSNYLHLRMQWDNIIE